MWYNMIDWTNRFVRLKKESKATCKKRAEETKMEIDYQGFSIFYDRSEVSKCLFCHDPECTKACPQKADVGEILRSLYFQNYLGAVTKITCDCTYCNAPCEKACVLTGRKWQPTPVFLPGESQGQGSLVGCCLWDRTESDTTECSRR